MMMPVDVQIYRHRAYAVLYFVVVRGRIVARGLSAQAALACRRLVLRSVAAELQGLSADPITDFRESGPI